VTDGRTDGRLDVTVLLGGPSSEREVSLASGRAVADALRRCGHDVTESDISPADTAALDRPGIDVVFIALHGTFGENGKVQQLCEDRRLPYVGSGPAASELAMDKHRSKQAFRAAGVATADWALVSADDTPKRVAELLGQVPPPCVLKPVDSGSSVGVHLARDAAARDDVLPGLLAGHGRALVEKFIPGRELTVGILEDRPLPVVEIRPKQEFFDFFAKYEDDQTEFTIGVELPGGATEAVQAEALKIHRAFGCRDLSRVDFILAADGTAYALEVNTIPGFTSHSLVPKSAATVGIGFEPLCDQLVRMALRRAGR